MRKTLHTLVILMMAFTVILMMAFTCWLYTPVGKGLKQEIVWQNRPPYHWVTDKDNNSYHQEFYYIGANGEKCATVWTGITQAGWVVYGYDIHGDHLTFEQAQQMAYENCY